MGRFQLLAGTVTLFLLACCVEAAGAPISERPLSCLVYISVMTTSQLWREEAVLLPEGCIDCQYACVLRHRVACTRGGLHSQAWGGAVTQGNVLGGACGVHGSSALCCEVLAGIGKRGSK